MSIRAVIVATVLALLLPAGAAAEVRTGTVDDPRDQQTEINGANRPDVKSVSATFDNGTGTLTMSATFYESLDAPKPASYMYGLLDMNVATANNTGCWRYGEWTSIYLSAFYPGTTGTARVQQVDGQLPVTVSESGDGRTLTMTVSHPGLIGRDYRCISGGWTHYFQSTYSNPNSSYGAGCDCWYTVDWDFASGYFNGFAPVSRDPIYTPPTYTPPTYTPLPTEPAPRPARRRATVRDAPLPLLTKDDAIAYALDALGRKFKKSGPHVYSHINNCLRHSRTKLTCFPAWSHKSSRYSGRVAIWLVREADRTLHWHYSFRIIKRQVGCGERCTRVISVK